MSAQLDATLEGFAPAPERAPAAAAKPSRAARAKARAREFQVYFIATYPIFLVVAVASRALPRRWRPSYEAGRSVFGDARAAALTVLPFVFMS